MVWFRHWDVQEQKLTDQVSAPRYTKSTAYKIAHSESDMHFLGRLLMSSNADEKFDLQIKYETYTHYSI